MGQKGSKIKRENHVRQMAPFHGKSPVETENNSKLKAESSAKDIPTENDKLTLKQDSPTQASPTKNASKESIEFGNAESVLPPPVPTDILRQSSNALVRQSTLLRQHSGVLPSSKILSDSEEEEEIEDWLAEEIEDSIEGEDSEKESSTDEEDDDLSPFLRDNKPLYDVVRSVQLFCSLSQNQQEQIVRALKPVRFSNGECIVRQGEKGSRFYMIAKGTAVVMKRIEKKREPQVQYNDGIVEYEDKMVTHLHPGHYFGELALLYNDPRTATVRAVEDVELLYLTQEDFHQAGNVHLTLILKQVPLLAQLNPRDQDAVLSLLQPANFNDGEYIVRQGEEGDRFYIITRGEAVVTEKKNRSTSSRSVLSPRNSYSATNLPVDEKELTRLYEGHIFGEMSLFSNEPRTASVIAIGAVKCLFLIKEDFEKSLKKDRFNHLIQKTYQEKATVRELRKQKQKSSEAIPNQTLDLQVHSEEARETKTLVKQRLANGQKVLNKYVIKGDLGRGTYGRVKLCQSEEDNQLYAVKILSKTLVQRLTNCEDKLQDMVRREVAIMKKLHHPNVVALHEVIDDPSSQKMYLIQEYVEKGNLSEIMQQSDEAKGLGEEKAKKYTRDILMGLQYLHFQNVIHRDIKPENLLVTKEDTVKIADFGTARTVMNRSETLTEAKGTPAFMAPELFDPNATYLGPSVDVWSLGATLFMMVTGMPPWMAENEILLSEKIRNDEVVFPDDNEVVVSPHLRNLILRMMTKDPEERMTLEQVMRHEWVTKEGSSMLQMYKKEDAVTVTMDESEAAIRNIPEHIDLSLQDSLMKAHSLIKHRNGESSFSKLEISKEILEGTSMVMDRTQTFPTSGRYSDRREVIEVTSSRTESNRGSGTERRGSMGSSRNSSIRNVPSPRDSLDRRSVSSESLDGMMRNEGFRVINAWRRHRRVQLVEEHTQLSQRIKDLLVEQKRVAFSADRADVTEIVLDVEESNRTEAQDSLSGSTRARLLHDDTSDHGVCRSPSSRTGCGQGTHERRNSFNASGKYAESLHIRRNSLGKQKSVMKDEDTLQRSLSRKKDFLMVTSEVLRDQSGDLKKRKVMFQARNEDFSIVSKMPGLPSSNSLGTNSSASSLKSSCSAKKILGMSASASSSSQRIRTSSSFNSRDSISSPCASPLRSSSSNDLDQTKSSSSSRPKLSLMGKLFSGTSVGNETCPNNDSTCDDSYCESEDRTLETNTNSGTHLGKHQDTLSEEKGITNDDIDFDEVYSDDSGTSSDDDDYSDADELENLNETFDDLIKSPRNDKNGFEEIDDEIAPLSGEEDPLDSMLSESTGFESPSSAERSLKAIFSPPQVVCSTPHHENLALGVRIGVAEAKGKRSYMEDRIVVKVDFLHSSENDDTYDHVAFGGVYDGHNGTKCVETLVTDLHHHIHENLIRCKKDPEDSIHIGCKQMDDKIVQRDFRELDVYVKKKDSNVPQNLNSAITFSGSTAVLVLIAQQKQVLEKESCRTIYAANVGDCRAVLCRAGEAIDLTVDHKASLAEEKARIEACGGFVHNGRLNGVLAVSRSFGDTMHKENEQLIAVPDVLKKEIKSEDEFLLLATDGLYDVLNSKQCVNFVRRKLREHQDVELAANQLVEKALSYYTQDNVSVMIIALNQTQDQNY